MNVWFAGIVVVNEVVPGVPAEPETSRTAGFWLVMVTLMAACDAASMVNPALVDRLEPTMDVPFGAKVAVGFTVIGTVSDVRPLADAVTVAVQGSDVVPPCDGWNVVLTRPAGW